MREVTLWYLIMEPATGAIFVALGARSAAYSAGVQTLGHSILWPACLA